jgi:hypothetical protein
MLLDSGWYTIFSARERDRVPILWCSKTWYLVCSNFSASLTAKFNRIKVRLLDSLTRSLAMSLSIIHDWTSLIVESDGAKVSMTSDS